LATDDSSYNASNNQIIGNPAAVPVLSLDGGITRSVFAPAVGQGFIYQTGINFNTGLPNGATSWTEVFNVQ
jgi:hypothetical protein